VRKKVEDHITEKRIDLIEKKIRKEIGGQDKKSEKKGRQDKKSEKGRSHDLKSGEKGLRSKCEKWSRLQF